MPFALVPDGFTLQKVTKAEEKAVKDYTRHSSIKELLGNELAMTALITPVIALAVGTLGAEITKLILSKLKEEGVTVTEKVEKEIKETVGGIQTGVATIQEAVTTGRIGASFGSPVTVPVETLPEELFKEALRRFGLKVD